MTRRLFGSRLTALTDRKHATVRGSALGLVLVVLLSACAGAPSSGGAPAAPAVASVTLTVISGWEKGIVFEHPMPEFLKAVEKASNGAIKLEYKGGPEIVPPFEQAGAVSKGAFDIALTTSAFYASLAIEADAAYIGAPGVTLKKLRDSGALAALDQMHQEKIGVKVLGFASSSYSFIFVTKRRLEKADFSGMKIRAVPLYVPLIERMGGAPAVIPPQEVYTALERNTVDGFGWPEIGIDERKFYEVAKFIMYPAWYEVRQVYLMNLDKWKSLSEGQQRALTDAMRAVEDWAGPYYTKLARDERDRLKQRGMTVVDLPKAEADKLLKIAEDSGWGRIIDKSPQWGPRLREAFSKAR